MFTGFTFWLGVAPAIELDCGFSGEVTLRGGVAPLLINKEQCDDKESTVDSRSEMHGIELSYRFNIRIAGLVALDLERANVNMVLIYQQLMSLS